MTWNTTKTWAVGDLFVAGDANSILRDDVQYNRDTERVIVVSKDVAVASNNGGSTAYVDFSAAGFVSTTFTKRQADSSILVESYGSAYVTGAVGDARFGVKIGATDYDGRLMYFSTLNVHESWFSTVNVTGLAAGVYTVTLRVKSVVGTVVLSADGNDGVSMEVSEASLN